MEKNKKILIVGEGNLSFSCAFHSLQVLNSQSEFYQCQIIGTTFESKTECLKKYGIELTMKNIEYLKENKQTVLHGIDATNLQSCLKGISTSNVTKIIFNFPHTGKKAAIQNNR